VSGGELAALFGASIGAGVFGAMLGLGGGIFLVPILTLLFGYSFHTSVSASLIAVIATSSAAAATYVKEHLTNIRLGIVLETATTIGAVSGGLIAVHISANILAGVFAAVALYTSVNMLRRKRTDNARHVSAPTTAVELSKTERDWAWAELSGSFYDKVLEQRVEYRPRRLPWGMGASVFAGMMSGMLGIGGGPIKVPIMYLIMRVPMRAAVGTSNFMVGVTAVASAFIYYNHGYVDPAIVVPTALGVVVGAEVGARISQRVRLPVLSYVFSVVLLYVAVQMLLDALGVHVGI